MDTLIAKLSVRTLLPSSSCFYPPFLVTNPGYMKDAFFIELLTIHASDDGTTENIHQLSASDWKKVEVVKIDICNPDPALSSADNDPKLDPL